MTLSKELGPFPWRELAIQPVIGVDEVGRGCLAGPVHAAAVIIPDGFDTQGLTDSKKISEKKRNELSQRIHDGCIVGIGVASVEEIGEINILWASLLAMKRAVDQIKVDQAFVLVDGNREIPKIAWPQQTLIKGDFRAAPVAAASIVAKVFRDNLMTELGAKYPGYGLEKHKGYGTPIHKKAIQELGPVPGIHRATFAGVKEHLQIQPQPTTRPSL